MMTSPLVTVVTTASLALAQDDIVMVEVCAHSGTSCADEWALIRLFQSQLFI
jgi:hypothetical protein